MSKNAALVGSLVGSSDTVEIASTLHHYLLGEPTIVLQLCLYKQLDEQIGTMPSYTIYPEMFAACNFHGFCG